MSGELDPARWRMVVYDQHGNAVKIRELVVPIAIAIGEYERLTEEELNDHAADIRAELGRRS